MKLAKASAVSVSLCGVGRVRVAPTGKLRPAFVYSDNVRTDEQRKSPESGLPLSAMSAAFEIDGQRLQGRVSTTTSELPEDLPLGAVLEADGAYTLTITRDDQFGLRYALQVEDLEEVIA